MQPFYSDCMSPETKSQDQVHTFSLNRIKIRIQRRRNEAEILEGFARRKPERD